MGFFAGVETRPPNSAAAACSRLRSSALASLAVSMPPNRSAALVAVSMPPNRSVAESTPLKSASAAGFGFVMVSTVGLLPKEPLIVEKSRNPSSFRSGFGSSAVGVCVGTGSGGAS